MKNKLLGIVFFLYVFVNLYSNDTYYYIAGGNIFPAEPNQTNVEMVDEIINIDLFDDYYSVTVVFTFYNNGADENLLVGFPYLLQNQNDTSPRIYDFKTWVNGHLVNHSNDKIEYSGLGYNETIVDHAFTKNVFFSAKEITRTKVDYKVQYGSAAPSYRMATYYYGSGRAWYNSIGKITINIKNNISRYDAWIYEIQMPKIGFGNYSSNIPVEYHTNWNNGFLQIQLSKIKPNENDTIAIWIGRPLWDMGPMVFRPDRFYYRTHLLENKEIRFLSKSQLRIFRNAFYAFHGYNFRDDTLKSFFLNFDPPWYSINENFNENMLADIERINVNKIIEEEERR
jgi:hypothetical protein